MEYLIALALILVIAAWWLHGIRDHEWQRYDHHTMRRRINKQWQYREMTSAEVAEWSDLLAR
jgi:hypothetical protein